MGVDQPMLAQMVEHNSPVAVTEGVDDDAALPQHQRHRTVGHAMTWCRDIGPAAPVVKITAEDVDVERVIDGLRKAGLEVADGEKAAAVDSS